MEYMVKVSVIIPVYNCEEYIDKCLGSLMRQTDKDFEILLMVGFGKDGSLTKCLEWQKKDERVIVISRRDSSLGDARNYALRIARGKYIAYLDADDFYNEDYIERMSTPLEEDATIDISCCGYDCFKEGQVSEGELPYKEDVVRFNFKEYIGCIPAAAVWLKMFRRKWLLDNQIEMFDGCCEDQALHFILAALVKKAYLIRQPLYHYNIGNAGSLVRTLKSRLDYAAAMEYAIKELKKRGMYKSNRKDMIRRICLSYKGFLQETNNNEELLKICKGFFEQYFPEVVEEYEFYRKQDKRIKNKVVLYSAGADAETFLQNRGTEGISYIVDKNPDLQGEEKHGLMIKPIEVLYGESEEVSVIVASSRYYFEIVKELREHHLYSLFTPELFCDEAMVEELFESDKEKNVILFNTPLHANVGDHMIVEAEKLFFDRYLPDYHVVEVTSSFYKEFHHLIYGLIKKDDMIAITGGGFLGSLWMENGEAIVRSIMTEYRDRQIAVFPQSIFFEDTDEGKNEKEQSRKVYNRCENLIIFFREKESYKRGIEIMQDEAVCRLIPDIVLSVNKDDFIKDDKICVGNKAAICMKNCKESVFSNEDKREIVDILKRNGRDVCSMSMYAGHNICAEERREYIEDKLKEIGGYAVVVTDALHCMISCALMGTPCIALNNISGKVKGVYQWICDLPYIEYVESICDIEKALAKVMNAENENQGYRFNYRSFFKQLVECFKK